MTPLEHRYRVALRMLPAGYRASWEDDMVSAYLDSVDTGDPERTQQLMLVSRPSWSEVASIGVLALQVRLRGDDSCARSRARADGVRLAVLIAALATAVTAGGELLAALWLGGRLGPRPIGVPEWGPAGQEGWAQEGFWPSVVAVSGVCWLPAYAALARGRRRAAQAVALLVIVPSALGALVQAVTDDHPPILGWVLLLFDVVLVVAMTAYPDGVPPPRHGRWLLALPIGVVVVAMLSVVQVLLPLARAVDPPAVACVAVALAAAVHGRARRAGEPPTAPATATATAIALLAIAALALRLLTLPDYVGQVDAGALAVAGVIEALALAVAARPHAGALRRASR